jgi:hypothetical protein
MLTVCHYQPGLAEQPVSHGGGHLATWRRQDDWSVQHPAKAHRKWCQEVNNKACPFWPNMHQPASSLHFQVFVIIAKSGSSCDVSKKMKITTGGS